MKSNKIAILAAALTFASVSEFLEAYPVEVHAEENQIQISSRESEKKIAFRDLMNPATAENELEKLFVWLAPNDLDGVIEDWNMHVERETGVSIRPSLAERIGEDEAEG